MSTPLLATKLYLPPPRPAVVRRERLLARLSAGAGRPLTLVAAPAGFGKTTLLSDWLAELGRPAAWLSLDEGERSPSRLLAYIVAALQTRAPGVGVATLAALHTAQPPPVETLLTLLLNDLAALPADLLLVLDDYHSVDSPPVAAAMTFMLDHLPPRLHLVIATRAEPDLPLARLRARNQLSELGAADLRFTTDEAATFLTGSMGLTIAAPDVATLERRTEGWAVGLQLAALALQGRAAAHNVAETFSGGHRLVLDYLVGEALLRQPEQMRRFLLQTAVLDRLSAPLCEAVTGEAGGRATLAALERANLFIVALDAERRWYRYHHLFAEALRAQLDAEQPGEAATLHLRAAHWLEQQGLAHEAIRHALAAGAFDHAALLIEREWPAMDAGYQSDTWLGWAQALPEAQIVARPILCLGYAWALLNQGDLEGAEPWLQRAEGWLSPSAAAGPPPPVVDPAQLQVLPTSIASARAFRALALGDTAATLRYAQQALAAGVAPAHPNQLQARALLGIAQWAAGELEAADRSLSVFTDGLLAAGRVGDAVGMAFILAAIRTTRGRLHEAFAACERSLQLIARHGQAISYGVEEVHRALAELYRERDELARAEACMAAAEAAGARGGHMSDWRPRLYVTQARLLEARGDLVGALERLDEAERHFIRTPLPDHQPIAALRARVAIRAGDLEAALGWAGRHGVTADGPPRFLDEFAQITLARLLIARARAAAPPAAAEEALRLLGRLLAAAEAGGRAGSAIEILILQALAHQARADTAAALAPLRRALALAEPEGYVRLFLDEGEPLLGLLRLVARRAGASAYARRLLATAGDAERAPAALPLAEPLSEREHDVLRLLGSELSGPELARELAVSLNTLRTHTRSIYSKLGVRSRQAALRRARELGLLP